MGLPSPAMAELSDTGGPDTFVSAEPIHVHPLDVADRTPALGHGSVRDYRPTFQVPRRPR